MHISSILICKNSRLNQTAWPQRSAMDESIREQKEIQRESQRWWKWKIPVVAQRYLTHLLFSPSNAHCSQDILAQKPQICFSNIKHKGKTLTASVVNKSLPWEGRRQTGGGWHTCRRKLNTIFFLPAQVAICCSDQESLSCWFQAPFGIAFHPYVICWYALCVWY